VNAALSVNGIPRVSVVVPNYNHAPFLRQRIDSILNQSFQDFELQLLDDASTDASSSVFAEYAQHPKVSAVTVNERNSGSPYRQWNRGAHWARGEYLWIAESDDYADLTFLERMVAVMDAHPNVGVSYCRSFKVDTDSKIFGSTADWTQSLHATRWETDHVSNGRDECVQYWLRRCIIPNVSSALLRRSVLERAGYAHDAMRFCGDYATYVRMLEIADVAYVASPLNYFRFSSTSMRTKMASAWLHDLERAQIMAYICRHFSVPPDVSARAAEQFIEQLIRATLRSPDAARIYLAGYPKMRATLNGFCPHPDAKALAMVVNGMRRKVSRFLRSP